MKPIDMNNSYELQYLSTNLKYYEIGFKSQSNKAYYDRDLLFIESICHFIKKHYRNNQLTVKDIADHFHMSIRKLQAKVKSLTSFSPYEFVIAYRLEQASKCLAYTNDSIIDIIYEHGYTDPCSFYRLFKKYFRMTPHEFRRQMHQYNNSEYIKSEELSERLKYFSVDS